MLLINASTHRIICDDSTRREILPYQLVEQEFPTMLVERYAQSPREQVLVINGPGAFTTLRVACLSINTLAHIHPSIMMYQITKPELYQYLYTQWRIGSTWLMYIGQQKAIRTVDLSGYTETNYEKIPLIQGLEQIWSHPERRVDEGIQQILTDEQLSMIHSNQRCHIWIQDDQICCSFGEWSRLMTPDQLPIQHVPRIIPDYMIQPTGT
jgi:hypothetical protein